LNRQKCHFLFFYKLGEQEGRTGLVWRAGTSERRENVGKGCRRVNTEQILYTHVCKWKSETIPGMRWGKENDGGGEFSYDTFDIL
jgi:hypothetical protein